jgi:hypothetical protein
MSKKLTITVDDQIYQLLYEKIGARKIGKFLQALVRPYLIDDAIDQGYAAMAQDTDREKTALEWAENTLYQEV